MHFDQSGFMEYLCHSCSPLTMRYNAAHARIYALFSLIIALVLTTSSDVSANMHIAHSITDWVVIIATIFPAPIMIYMAIATHALALTIDVFAVSISIIKAFRCLAVPSALCLHNISTWVFTRPAEIVLLLLSILVAISLYNLLLNPIQVEMTLMRHIFACMSFLPIFILLLHFKMLIVGLVHVGIIILTLVLETPFDAILLPIFVGMIVVSIFDIALSEYNALFIACHIFIIILYILLSITTIDVEHSSREKRFDTAEGRKKIKF